MRLDALGEQDKIAHARGQETVVTESVKPAERVLVLG